MEYLFPVIIIIFFDGREAGMIPEIIYLEVQEIKNLEVEISS